jgi:cytochrome P450
MTFSNFSLFPNSTNKSNVSNNHKNKSFGENLFDTFNYYFNYGTFNRYYEHSPINLSTITGMYHPSIQRLKGNPFLGRALNVPNANGLAKEVEKLTEISTNDPLGRAYLSFGFEQNLLITRPEDIAQIFIHNHNNIDRGAMLEVFAKIFGDTNLFTVPNSEQWREKRTQLTKWILEEDALTNLVCPMQEIIDQFIEEMKYKNGHIDNLETFTVSLTMDVFAKCGLASKRLDHNAKKISDEFGKSLSESSLPMNTMLVRLDKTLKYVGVCLTKHLDKQRESLQNTLKENFFQPNLENLFNIPNILQEHLKKYSDDPETAFKNIQSDLGLLLLAGHETTSRLLQFTLISLAQNPDVLEKLREEIALYQSANGKWTHQDLNKLTYLDKVIKETLRLYPPVPIIPRRVTNTCTLANIPLCNSQTEYKEAMKKRNVNEDVILHAGTNIIVASWFTHQLPSLYEDPKRFNPDRHKSGSIKSTDNFTMLAFGAGLRSCPGKFIAVEEAKIFIAQLIMKYNFNPTCEGAKLGDTETWGTLKHAGTLQFNFTPRNTEDQSPKFKL